MSSTASASTDGTPTDLLTNALDRYIRPHPGAPMFEKIAMPSLMPYVR